MAETISDINISTQNYDTLTLWETDKDGDITAGNAEVARCFSDDGDLPDSVVFSGWTTDADSYIAVKADSGSRHDGTATTGFTLNNDNAGDTFSFGVVYIHFEGFIIDGSGYNYDGMDSTGGASAGSTISYMIIHNTGTQYALRLHATTVASIWNCVLYNVVRALYMGSQNASVDLYNCATDGNAAGDYGILRGDCWNVVSYNYTTNDFFNIAAGDYNFSKDDTSLDQIGGANANSIRGTTDGKTPDFVTSPSDLHLQSTSDCIDVGDSASVGGLFTDDFEFVTRTGTWDMGAHEYVAVGGGLPIPRPLSRPFTGPLGGM